MKFLSDMRDGMTDKDSEVLYNLATDVVLSFFHKSLPVFIEIGSWKGYSAYVLGKVARQFQGHVFCIDHWQGSPGVEHHRLEGDCLEAFRTNIKELGMNRYIHPIVMESALAKTIIRNKVADLVFIDADHRYESVKHDIRAWESKVKLGGVLCGHDCEFYLKDLTTPVLDVDLNQDFNPDIGCHLGVVKAVAEYFGSNYRIEKGSTIWVKGRAN